MTKDEIAFNEFVKPAESYTTTSIDCAVKLRIEDGGAAAQKPITINKHFQEACELYQDLPALCYEDPAQSKWITITYAEYARKVEQAALMLLNLGLQPHDTVGILAHNCPEWVYCQFGTICAGGVIFGIYPTSSVDAVQHMLSLTGATICIVDTDEQMNKVRECQSQLPKLRTVIQLRGSYADLVGTQEGYYRWDDLFNQSFNDDLESELKLRQGNIYANECVMLMFTSGTTSLPKAVMISHDIIVYTMSAFFNTLSKKDLMKGRTVSYLPLCHSAVQFYEIFSSLHTGSCLYFADRNALKDTLVKTLLKARPTMLFGVPRIYEKLRDHMLANEAEMDNLSSFLVEKSKQALELEHTSNEKRKEEKPLWSVLGAHVAEKIKESVGLENCSALFCASAPLTADLKRFYLSMEMNLINSYGLSEVFGPVTVNMVQSKLTSVGVPTDGVECKTNGQYTTDGQGEINFRGRCVLMGYLNDPTKTKEAIDSEGWFYTGDVGYVDVDGHLIINGRIKELIITSGGENIPPLRIEEILKHELPAISNAMVVGDNRKYLTILLTLKTNIDPQSGKPTDTLAAETKEWLQNLGLKYVLLSEILNVMPTHNNIKYFPKIHPKIMKSIEAALQRTNSKALAKPQHIQKFTILPHDFSVATGELGPTLKLRRNHVLEKYKNIIDRMYE